MISDFEYDEVDCQDEHLELLMCPICCTLSTQPVRVTHVDEKQDCGAVMCLNCCRRWSAAH